MPKRKEDEPELLMRPLGKGGPQRGYMKVAGKKIRIVSAKEAEQASFVICTFLTIPLILPDNRVGKCSMCSRDIQWARSSPEKPKKICTDCLETKNLHTH